MTQSEPSVFWRASHFFFTHNHLRFTTMMASSSKKSSSSAETSQRIKSLLKELPEERADAAWKRLFAKLVTINGELSFHTAPPPTPTLLQQSGMPIY